MYIIYIYIYVGLYRHLSTAAINHIQNENHLPNPCLWGVYFRFWRVQTPIEHLHTFIHSWIPHPKSQILHNKLMFQIAFQTVWCQKKNGFQKRKPSSRPYPLVNIASSMWSLPTMDSMIIFRIENPYCSLPHYPLKFDQVDHHFPSGKNIRLHLNV